MPPPHPSRNKWNHICRAAGKIKAFWILSVLLVRVQENTTVQDYACYVTLILNHTQPSEFRRMPQSETIPLRARLPSRSGLNLFDFQRVFLFGGGNTGFMDPVDLCKNDFHEAILYCEEEDDEGHSFIFSRCEDSQLLFLPQESPPSIFSYARTLAFMDSPGSIATFFIDFHSTDSDVYRFSHPKLIHWRKKRHNNRLLLDTQLTISRKNGQQLLARLYDFSMTGIGFQTNVMDFSEGELVLIEFIVDNCGGYESAAIIIRQEENLHQNHKIFAAARFLPTKAQKADIERIYICNTRQGNTSLQLRHIHDSSFISSAKPSVASPEKDESSRISGSFSQSPNYYSPDNKVPSAQGIPLDFQSQSYLVMPANEFQNKDSAPGEQKSENENIEQQQSQTSSHDILPSEVPLQEVAPSMIDQQSTDENTALIDLDSDKPETKPQKEDNPVILFPPETIIEGNPSDLNTPPAFISPSKPVSHSREDSMSDQEQFPQAPENEHLQSVTVQNTVREGSTYREIPALRKSAKPGPGKAASLMLNNELALVFSQRGTLHLERFEFHQALEQFQRVNELLAFQDDGKNSHGIITLSQQELKAVALRGQAVALHALGRDQEASAVIEEALALLQAYPGAELQDMPAWLENLAITLLTHAQILSDQDITLSEREYRSALEQLDALVVKLETKSLPSVRLHLSVTLNSFAELFLAQEQTTDALSLIDRAQAVLSETPQFQQVNELPEWRLQFARLQGQRGQALLIQGKLQNAIQQNGEAEKLLTTLREQFKNNDMPALSLQSALNLNNQAQIFACTSDHEQVITLLDKSARIFEELRENMNKDFGPHLWISLAKTHLQRANSELAMGKPKIAQTSCEHATTILENLRNQENITHTSVLLQTLAESLSLQGKIYALLGDTQSAMGAFDQAVNILSA